LYQGIFAHFNLIDDKYKWLVPNSSLKALIFKVGLNKGNKLRQGEIFPGCLYNTVASLVTLFLLIAGVLPCKRSDI
jgi:hypothetical protein